MNIADFKTAILHNHKDNFDFVRYNIVTHAHSKASQKNVFLELS